MYALLKKEISVFFSSITGYLTITVFLTVVGLYMWIFPSDQNVLDSQYASMNTLFDLAPWVFLFLVPSVTMKLFSEEKRTGTFETLLTKPLREGQIILAKYLAALILIAAAILPTIIYFISIQYFLSAANMDVGGTIGSYIGLFCLAAIYASIGIFSSAITSNQVVAFMVGIVISFLLFIGFNYLSEMNFLKDISHIIDYVGIYSHYGSISRGVIDTRDIIYFASLASLFIFLTKFVLEKRKW